MDEVDPHKTDLIDLSVRLCTRIGMMMEDFRPVALFASREELTEWRCRPLRSNSGDGDNHQCCRYRAKIMTILRQNAPFTEFNA